MILKFEGMGEITILNIDREKREAKVTTSKTNYVEEEIPWASLFDRCDYHKRKLQQSNLDCDNCRNVEEQQDKKMCF